MTAADSAALLQNLGKGLAQLNLKLSRLLEREPAAAAPDETLEPLLDLLDAVDEAVARRPRRRLFRRRTQDDLWRGLALAAGRARDHLRSLGIEPIPSEGPFDDRLHQAVESLPGGGARAGALARTHRRGWTRGGRVLRTAQVSVWTE